MKNFNIVINSLIIFYVVAVSFVVGFDVVVVAFFVPLIVFPL